MVNVLPSIESVEDLRDIEDKYDLRDIEEKYDLRRRICNFWEVWEILRRLLLASILVLVLKGTAGQCEIQ